MTTNRVSEIVRKKLGPRPPRPTKAELEAQPSLLWHWMEAYSDHTMLEGLAELNEERKRSRAAAALRARRSKPGQYPHLHFAGGKRAGRIGAARFKGRYVPHLIYDRNAGSSI
jgi:hypothetical protein